MVDGSHRAGQPRQQPDRAAQLGQDLRAVPDRREQIGQARRKAAAARERDARAAHVTAFVVFLLFDLVAAAAIGAGVALAVGWEAGSLTAIGVFALALRQTLRWARE